MAPAACGCLGARYTALALDEGSRLGCEATLREAAGSLALAAEFLEDQELDDALSQAGSALEVFKAYLATTPPGARDVDLRSVVAAGAADAARLIAHAFAHMRKLRFAEEMAREELKALCAVGDLRAEAILRLALAELAAMAMSQEVRKQPTQSEVQLARSKRRKPAVGPVWAEVATDLAMEALKLFLSEEDALMLAVCKLTLSQIHLQNRRSNQHDSARSALLFAQEAAEAFDAAGDVCGTGKAHHNAAAASAALFEFEDAVGSGRRAFEAFRRIGDVRMEALEEQSIATWLLSSDMPEDALPHAEAAVSLLADMPRTLASDCSASRRPEREAMASAVVVRALGAQQEYHEALARAREAVKRARAADDFAGDDEAEGIANAALADALLMCGDVEGALNASWRAANALHDARSVELEVRQLHTIVELLLWTGSFKEAERIAQQAVDALRSCSADACGLCGALLLLGVVRILRGERKVAEEALGEAETLARRNSDAVGEARASLVRAQAAIADKSPGTASQLAERAVGLLENAGDPRTLALALCCLCRLEAERGNFRRAIRAVERAAALLEEARDRVRLAETLLLLAQTWLEDLRAPDARERVGFEEDRLALLRAAGEAESVARAVGEATLCAAVLCALAEALVVDDRGEEALAAADEALELFTSLGDAQGQASALLLQAMARRLMGRKADALKAAEDARALFEQVEDAAGALRAKQLSDEIAPTASPVIVAGGIPPQLQAKLDKESAMESQRKAIERMEKEREEEKKAKAASRKPRKEFGVIDLSGGLSQELVALRIEQMLDQELGIWGIDGDTPLMEAGITSTTGIFLQKALADEFGRVVVPSTVMFDYPSILGLSQYIIDAQK